MNDSREITAPVQCMCSGGDPHPHDPEWECPREPVTTEVRGTWIDPAIVNDERIQHVDPLVRRIAEVLHRNESMHMHWYVGSIVCPYCALRASVAVRTVRS